MFWKQHPKQGDTNFSNLNAAEIVSKVSGVYSDFNEQGQLVKPRASLPCSWFAARECFMIAYDAEFQVLPETLHNSYHFVFRELSFFVDDNLCKDFNLSLNIAAKCRSERMQALGISEDEAFCRVCIASKGVTVQDREEICAQLAHEVTCPKQHLALLAETLAYCSELHRAMRDEWATFSNLVAFRKKKK